MGVGDGADGAEEAAIVLGEVGSGGGVAQEIAQVLDGGGGDQTVEFADVVVLHAVQLPEQRSEEHSGVVAPGGFRAFGVGDQGPTELVGVVNASHFAEEVPAGGA